MSRLLACALAAAVASCAAFSKDYPEKTLYAFDVERGERVAADDEAPSLFVERLRPGPLVQGRGLVYRTAPSVYETDYYHELFGDPESLVSRSGVAWLSDSGLFASVAGEGVDAAPDLVLQGTLEALHVDLTGQDGPRAVLEARLFLTRREQGLAILLWSADVRFEEPCAGPRGEDVLAGWDAALERLWTRVERELRGALEREVRED